MTDKDRCFNIKDLPWKESGQGMNKMILDKSLLGSSSLRLVCLDPKTVFEAHEHSYMQVMIFKKSLAGHVIIDEDQKYPIEEDMVIIVHPNQCHRIFNESDERMEILVMESYDPTKICTPFVDF